MENTIKQNQQRNNSVIKSPTPPQAADFEKLIIGAIMVDKTAPDIVFEIIQNSNVFYQEKHNLIFRACFELYNNSDPIDLKTVSHQLRKTGNLENVGGDYYLIGLVSVITSAAHIEYYVRIVIQKYLMRRIILFNAQITGLAYSEGTDVFDLLDNWQREFDKVVDFTISGQRTIDFKTSLDELKINIERLSSGGDEMPMVGCPTGFEWADHHTGGYRNGTLIVLAARPGMGKTAKVLKTAIANLKIGNAVGMVSLEMSMSELTARMVSIDGDFHLNQLRKIGFTKSEYFEKYSNHSEKINKWPWYVDDNGINDITDVIILAKAWKRKYDIKLLIVDYLQLMEDKSKSGRGGNRENEISSISRKLKLLSKQLDIPVIAISQLSRAVETRGGSKRPLLMDLRESGAIEQDADIVEMIYRPGYYDLDITPDEYSDKDLKQAVINGGDSELIFRKFRGGSPGIILLKWDGSKTKFSNVFTPHRETQISQSTNEKTVFDAE